jgi:hypothetical protein
MSTVRFTAEVLPDGTIRVPQNVQLVSGPAEVTVEQPRVAESTLLPDGQSNFWSGASKSSLAAVWDNTEDDVYAQLLDQ